MEHNFNVKDRVLIREESEYYDGDGQLPPNVIGTITMLSGNSIEVAWEDENGDPIENVYGSEDLKSVVLIHPTIKTNPLS